jgi:hypothetical protein
MIMSPVVCLSAISCLALGAAVLAGQQEARPLRIEGSEAETLEAVIRGPQFHAPQGENTLDVRTRNFFGVEGPIVTATVRQKAR